MKNILKTILAYSLIYILNTFLFIVLMKNGFLKSVDVLMYRGVMVIFLMGIASALELYLLKRVWLKALINIKDLILIFMIYACVNVTLFTLIPVTVERSVSVFTLSYMSEDGNRGYTEEEIKQAFEDIYVDEFEAFAKRFHEQEVSGNIAHDEQEDKYYLTDNGQFIVDMFRTVADWFGTDERIVYPVTYNK